MRRFGFCLMVFGLCLASSGCSLMHNFQPHRMWRWNRGPAPSSNPFFSVGDPIPQLGLASEFPDSASTTSDVAEERFAAQ
jgi:hypothetical protein